MFCLTNPRDFKLSIRMSSKAILLYPLAYYISFFESELQGKISYETEPRYDNEKKLGRKGCSDI